MKKAIQKIDFLRVLLETILKWFHALFVFLYNAGFIYDYWHLIA